MRIAVLLAFLLIFISCKNHGKDSVEKADSANQARLERGLKESTIVIDEKSSAFLVRAISLLREIRGRVELYRKENQHPSTKDLLNKLSENHAILMDTVIALSQRKSIILPLDSSGKKGEIYSLTDKAIISSLSNTQEKLVELFENAILDSKNADIRSFADKALPLLRIELESVKNLEKKY